MSKAQQDLRDRRPDLAIPEFEAVLAIDPHNLDAQANAGVLLYFGNDFAKAVPHLQAALALKPDLWKLQALLGLAEMHLNNTADARTNLAVRAPAPHRREAPGRSRRSPHRELLADWRSGQTPPAQSQSCWSLSPPTPNSSCCPTVSTLTSPISSMLTMALTAPDSAEMHSIMARELQRHGDEAAAIANYRDAIQLNPKLPGVHYEFGILLYNSTDEKLQAEAAIAISGCHRRKSSRRKVATDARRDRRTETAT